jgi:hypothetical protein
MLRIHACVGRLEVNEEGERTYRLGASVVLQKTNAARSFRRPIKTPPAHACCHRWRPIKTPLHLVATAAACKVCLRTCSAEV